MSENNEEADLKVGFTHYPIGGENIALKQVMIGFEPAIIGKMGEDGPEITASISDDNETAAIELARALLVLGSCVIGSQSDDQQLEAMLEGALLRFDEVYPDPFAAEEQA